MLLHLWELNKDCEYSKDFNKTKVIELLYLCMFVHSYVHTHTHARTQAYTFSPRTKTSELYAFTVLFQPFLHHGISQKILFVKTHWRNLLRPPKGKHHYRSTVACSTPVGKLGFKGSHKTLQKSLTHILSLPDSNFIFTYAYSCENTTPQHFYWQYPKKATRWRYYAITIFIC